MEFVKKILPAVIVMVSLAAAFVLVFTLREHPKEDALSWIRDLDQNATQLENKDVDELVSKIKKDLKIEKAKVKILVGSYSKHFIFNAQIEIIDSFGYCILINKNFSDRLDPPEVKALIAHEMGHASQVRNPFGEITFDGINQDQIEADLFAIRYVDPESLISMLNKADVMLTKIGRTRFQQRIDAIRAAAALPAFQKK